MRGVHEWIKGKLCFVCESSENSCLGISQNPKYCPQFEVTIFHQKSKKVGVTNVEGPLSIPASRISKNLENPTKPEKYT